MQRHAMDGAEWVGRRIGARKHNNAPMMSLEAHSVKLLGSAVGGSERGAMAQREADGGAEQARVC